MFLVQSPKKVNKGTGGLGNKRTSRDYPSYYIIENGQNTEKSPGDLTLASSQTPVKDSQGVNNNQNNVQEV